LQLSYALNTALPTTSVPINQKQYTAMLELKSILNGLNMNNTSDSANAQRLSTIQKYLAGSSTDYLNGVPFQELKSVVSSIVSPLSRPVFGAAANSNIEEDYVEVSVPRAASTHTFSSSSISFIQPSEIY
jgi:hypothetical protein